MQHHPIHPETPQPAAPPGGGLDPAALKVTIQPWPGDGMCLVTAWDGEGTPPVCVIMPSHLVTDEVQAAFRAFVALALPSRSVIALTRPARPHLML